MREFEVNLNLSVMTEEYVNLLSLALNLDMSLAIEARIEILKAMIKAMVVDFTNNPIRTYKTTQAYITANAEADFIKQLAEEKITVNINEISNGN